MPRKTVLIAVVAAVLAGPANAGPVALMPGVSYERQVRFTPRGPVVIHVMRGPKPGGLYALRPILANDVLLGRETVTSMQRRASAGATVAGVNGDFSTWDEGLPTGMLMQSGVLKAPPHPRRSSLGITDDGTFLVERVAMLGQWQGSGPRRLLNGLNQRPGAQGTSLFTPDWGPSTPVMRGAVEVVLQPLPPAAPNTALPGTVAAITLGGGTPIPSNGAVLMARGGGATWLAAEAAVGEPMTVRLILRPQWGAVVDAIGGGPVIVRDGQPVFRALEDFTASQLYPRAPRTGVGQLADGRLVFVVVDGRQARYSVGVTNFELAQILAGLGVVRGTALDSGGSSAMAFDGKLLNRPSDRGGERPVGDSLALYYYGVHAPPPAQKVVSPNGDGVAETQSLSYKLVRPSTVTASIVGPDRIPRQTDTGAREPGVYRLTWSGRTAEGAPELEGRWRWVINAVDLTGQHSVVERSFWLNTTLARLRTRSVFRVRMRRSSPLRIGFFLANPARVRVTIETAYGTRVRTVANRVMLPGTKTVRWDGRFGNRALAYRGLYVVRVLANNRFGSVELSRRFIVRRARR
ncbi:MAG TPA: phosphodiester glycosidase family protein [Gaiellaceae bacterium]|nr:phosphodiester glycosidase family protein [Gaiellaceae bacterium]